MIGVGRTRLGIKKYFLQKIILTKWSVYKFKVSYIVEINAYENDLWVSHGSIQNNMMPS